MSEAISISCASDEDYYCGLLVTLHSLVSHAKEGRKEVGLFVMCLIQD